MNILHSTITFGNGTVSLMNIEPDEVTELITIPCPVWADRKVMAEMIKTVAISRNLY